MLRNTRRGFGAGLVRGGGQIAMSVAATLIATGLFTLLRPAAPPVQPSPELTSGGKYGARIAGAETPAAVPERPRLSIVDWSIGSPVPTRLIADAAWNEPVASEGQKLAAAEPRLNRRPLRRPAPVAPAASPSTAIVRPSAPIPAAEPPPDGLLASATSAVVSVASGTRQVVEAAGSGALQLSAAAMGRVASLLP